MGNSRKKNKGKSRKRLPRNEQSVRDDIFEAESDSDNESRKRKRRVRRVDNPDEEADFAEYELPEDFEDEEIDEDAAFNDKDEELYGEFFTKEEEGGASIGTDFDPHKKLPQGAVFLSDLLNESDSSETKPKNGKNIAQKRQQESSKSRAKGKVEAEDEDDSEEESESMSEDSSDEDESDEDDSDANSKKSKLLNMLGDLKAKSKLKKKKTKVRTEVSKEGEFNLSGSGKLTLDQMMSGLKSQSSSDYGELKKKLSKLEGTSQIGAPVATVVEERAERKVGFEKAQEQANEWNTKVQQNRYSKSLSFPLNDPGRRNVSVTSLASSFTAKTDLETEVQKALEQSGLAAEADIRKREEEELVEQNDEDIEQLKKRRGELSKLRALLFYEEQKRKRAKKIKSKKYRKIKKRKLAREEEKEMEELRRIDPKAAKEIEDEAALKRAHERMTLKHKNTSKFIRGLLKHGGTHRSRSRTAIVEQLKQGEALSAKMKSMNDEGDSDGFSSDGEEDSASKHARKLLEGIKQDKLDFKNEDKKGLMGLKFMQRGVEKKRLRAEEEAKNLLKEIDQDSDNDGVVEETINVGRRSFKPKKKAAAVAEKTNSSDNESSNEGKDVSDKEGLKVVRETKTSGYVKASNTFKVPKFSEVRERTEIENSDKANEAEVENPWLEIKKKSTREKKSSGQSTQIEINLDGALNVTNKSSGSNEQTVATSAQELEKRRQRKEQNELMKRAFVNAGAAEEDFDAELDNLENRNKESDKAEDLAGWGSWTGAGVAKKINPVSKKSKKDKRNPGPKSQKKRRRVIVNEKRNKKFSKYLVEKVPYPFTSREQYERSLSNPLGNDWNTMSSYKDAIRPAVITKAGTIIEPLKK
mmetsp:Transcript_16919/g.22148  ORF Transcript_16919/g.22148 Transcript_16919/m.22148 type:complete len:867 (+) Transcript_16919:59-2659(+)